MPSLELAQKGVAVERRKGGGVRAAARVIVVEREGAEVPHILEQRREGSLQPVLSKLRG